MCSWGFWGLGIRFRNRIDVFQLPLWCNITLIMDKCWGCYRLNTQPNFMILGLSESYKFCVHSALVKCYYIMHAEPIYWALAYWMLFPCSWFTCLYGWYYCTIKYLMICSVYLQSMSGFHHHLIEEMANLCFIFKFLHFLINMVLGTSADTYTVARYILYSMMDCTMGQKLCRTSAFAQNRG